MGAVTKEMEKHNTNIRRDRVGINRDQAIVERLNRTLAERLFGPAVCFRNSAARGPSASRAFCGLRPERRSDSLDWQKTC